MDRSVIVVRRTERGWVARWPDGMASGRGETAEAAVAAFLAGTEWEGVEYVDVTPPVSPEWCRMFRRRESGARAA